MGEDTSEILDLIAAQMKVIEIARLKKSCRCCERWCSCPRPAVRYQAAWLAPASPSMPVSGLERLANRKLKTRYRA
nr:IS66 family transposase zinc-finger binding domain-containing protein [Mesorhizobium sp.]